MAVSMNRSARSFARVARGLAETPGVLPTVQGVVDRAVEIVPCDWAIVAVTEQISSTPARISASTDPALAPVIADIAGRFGSSPGIDAFTGGATVVANDLASETRYAEYAREMVKRTGVRAVLSLGLRLSDAPVGELAAELVETGTVEGLEARVEAERSMPAPHEASAPPAGQQQAG